MIDHRIFILTVTSHLALLLIFSITFKSVQQINLGKSHAIISYVYQAQSIPQLNQQEKITHLQKIPLSKPHLRKQLNAGITAHNLIKEGNGRPISELTALLHAAIQAQQSYPLSALQMERAGRAILVFLLFPNGTIKHLKIAKSSGTDALDEASIAAVIRAVPFKGVDKYLAQPQEYQISVEFELS